MIICAILIYGDIMKDKDTKTPQWYWSRGLHDARIISATIKESAWNPDDTRLILEIDCDGALFEKDIVQIRFDNFKNKTTDLDINLLNGGWWLSDELVVKGDHYFIDLKFDTAKCKTKHIEFTFSDAKVKREVK